jgi:hypothetical protein
LLAMPDVQTAMASGPATGYMSGLTPRET